MFKALFIIRILYSIDEEIFFRYGQIVIWIVKIFDTVRFVTLFDSEYCSKLHVHAYSVC